uniref:Potassium channel, subfamily K, member 1b n=1 Tax=Callorhinchus milii TaxID=7868 RepID=A0A4W3KFK9_CALMI
KLGQYKTLFYDLFMAMTVLVLVDPHCHLPAGCGASPAGCNIMICFCLPGYGHTVPLSDGGKAFCIIYCVIGIPFTLLFLTSIVQRIMVPVSRRPVQYIHTRWGYTKQTVAIVHAVILGIIVVSLFLFIPAVIFSIMEEDWNFLESIYFCFISLSTIGLGDYVPGEVYHQKFRELYKLGITVYLMIGLTAVLVVLETFCELRELKQFKRIFYVKKEKEEDQLNIVDHEQFSFSSVVDSVPTPKEEQKLNEPFMTVPSVYQATDGTINR